MSYNDTAKNLLKDIGGTDNVNSLVHCATRLRFTLKDNDLANDQAVENIPGVVGLVKGGGQYQVIIGPDVANVYNELQKEGLSDSNTQPFITFLRNSLHVFQIMVIAVHIHYSITFTHVSL